jgi:undecaprenyl diphosphate synthase
MTDSNKPRHIAIIMDGNGRWAQKRGLPRIAGHREGMFRVKEVITAAIDLEIEAMTLFAFSAENWSRPKKEVDLLMRALVRFLRNETKGLVKSNIRFMVIGRDDPLPEFVLNEIRAVEKKTAGNTGLKLILALNYGSRQEIVDAAKKFCVRVMAGEAELNRLDEKTFEEYLYTVGLPEPDLLIRTSGEMRLSNFMLWQLSYAEFYFPKKHWPDFKTADFQEAVESYAQRKRRFGGIGK